MLLRLRLFQALKWLIIAALAATIAYAVLRGYLSPELLIGFANGLWC
jgi:hypothetical protein